MYSALFYSGHYDTANWHAQGKVHKWTRWLVVRTSDQFVMLDTDRDSVNLVQFQTTAIFTETVEYKLSVYFFDSFGLESLVGETTFSDSTIVSTPSRKAWAFTLHGHEFYVLNTPDDKTLLYDVVTGQWHRWYTAGWPFWNLYRGVMWRGKVLGADVGLPKIWELDPGTLLDEGTREIPRAVTGFQPIRGSGSVRQGYLRLIARRQSALGVAATVTLRFSDDGGNTWSSPRETVLSAADVSKRIEYRSLGRLRAPGRIWEIIDNGALIRIDGADMDLEGQ